MPSSQVFASSPPYTKCVFDSSCVGLVEKNPSGQKGKQSLPQYWNYFCAQKKDAEKYVIANTDTHEMFLDSNVQCECGDLNVCIRNSKPNNSFLYGAQRLFSNILNIPKLGIQNAVYALFYQ